MLQFGIRVLVVDDDPDTRELVAHVLEGRGFEVLVATSVDEALSKLEAFNPSVLVSDIGMPDKDGYTLIRSIRTHPANETKALPAIALTAFTRPEDERQCLSAGFNLHMTKPVELPALAKAVADLAGARAG